MKTNTLFLNFLALAFLCGCSTRTFLINTEPTGSLLLHSSSTYFQGTFVAITDTSSVKHTLTFFGKKDSSFYTAMKRGYTPNTVYVTKFSEPNVKIKLNRIENVSEILYDTSKLNKAQLILLPVEVEVVLHKGVGNLDKYEKSDELSYKVTDSINILIKKAVKNEQSGKIAESSLNCHQQEWLSIKDELAEDVLSLNPPLLLYYGIPPTVNKVFEIDSAIFSSEKMKNNYPDKDILWVYIWCKTVKATTGRVVGNLAANVAAGAVTGYQTAVYGYSTMVYDPGAFTIDNSTLMLAYYIHPETGEIVHIEQLDVAYDITKPKSQKTFSEAVLAKLSFDRQ